MLQQAGPEGVTSNQFYAAFLPRFGARIHELRNKGFNIAKEPVERGHFRYILVGQGTQGTQQSADHPGAVRPVGSGANVIGSQSCRAADDPPRDGPSSPMRVGEAEAKPAAAPGQLFEVDQDGPTGPVNPYEWEAA